ncbi:putative ripening-related protein 2 [Vitis vinifera]|uniref:Putative ripening-related protein 2 n=1 Tax=Vitis vinifera TaxID=29760 RepID=A0A438D9V0_VITVI|nr:putative ripening-related protein 2 [Vitis vinifera]
MKVVSPIPEICILKGFKLNRCTMEVLWDTSFPILFQTRKATAKPVRRSDCCEEGKLYTTYKCSPPVSSHTKAFLTLNGFENNEDGGAPSECDGQFHSDDMPVVALSTGWYNKGSGCLNNITITAKGEVWLPW